MLKKAIRQYAPSSVVEILRKVNKTCFAFIMLNTTKIKHLLRVKNTTLNHEDRKEEIIISLSTYPARFRRFHLVVESLLNQTMKPDRIIVNLISSEVGERIPKKILKLQRYGIEFCIRDDNLKPHNKYYYTMLDYPNSLIITVDDDHIYNKCMVEELYKTHKIYPNNIIAARGNRIVFKDGISNYNEWEYVIDDRYNPSMSILATGVGGVLYPPGTLHEDIFEKTLIRELALGQDDLWLKIMELKKGTKVVLCKKDIWKYTVELKKEQRTGLRYANCEGNENTMSWNKLLNYYELSERDFY